MILNFKNIFLSAFITISAISCYQKGITKTIEYSPGIWNGEHSMYMFLKWERDYYMPKGISRFPDGGIPKYIRDETFVCIYDSSTHEIKVIMKGKGFPRGYPVSARFSWKGKYAAYKIWNADETQNLLNPVILIDTTNTTATEFYDIGEMPELSPSGNRMATIRKNAIWTMKTDGTESINVYKASKFELIFIKWEKENLMELYVKDKGRFAVYTLDLTNGNVVNSIKPYVKNFGNESTRDILKL